MEKLVGIEAGDDAKLEGSIDVKNDSTASLSDHATDSLVYQLVRVEGDGRLIPATDDEVMEVENLLDNERSEIQLVADTGKAVESVLDKGFHLGKTRLADSEGILQPESLEIIQGNADRSASVNIDAQVEEFLSSSMPKLNKSHVVEPDNDGESLNPSNGVIEKGSSSCPSSSWMPDFSKLQGEICLDKLSVKELQETFKATFGRETSVKDKQWLKRRISMGLTNSCDVSTMTFVIKDNIVVKIDEEESSKNPVVETLDAECDGLLLTAGHNISIKNISSSGLECNYDNERHTMDPKVSKRLRKPTRRYIEELSEVESIEHGRKALSSNKSLKLGQSSPRFHVVPAQNVRSDGITPVMRDDSLGGSGVQIPCVSRVRRCRPRQNIMSLMKLQPSGMGVAETLIKKALDVRGPLLDYGKRCMVPNVSFGSGWIQQSLITESEAEEIDYSEKQMTELMPRQVDLPEGTSDIKDVTVSTLKGGIRRKHHRPWTLGEVVKLVEGVSKFGAGRWSEIKRLAFASYSYRTSVDLKDKWRNLLKASLAQPQMEEGNSRKHASIHIPAPILLQVRELAEIQARLPVSVSPTMSGGYNSSVHEVKSE